MRRRVRVLRLSRVPPTEGRCTDYGVPPGVVGSAANLLEVYDLLPEKGFDILYQRLRWYDLQSFLR